jgi:hypothetical protein
MSTQTVELHDPNQTVRIGRVSPPKQVFDPEPEKFRENFDRASFQFAHNLSGHPLFELPALLELSKSLPASDIYFDAGEVSVGQRWDAVPRTQLTVDQLIDRIENAGAWILLKKTNRDPRYAAILDQALAEAARMVGPAFPTRMKMRSAVVLVTSPNRISSYHIDPDCNFLCQLQGDKALYVYDRYDRENLPEQELERFWAVDKNAAVYKEKFQDRSIAYEMKPGVGVHMPLNAPHWVKNYNNISVTLALIFQYPDSHLGHAYRFNHYWRKLGLNPKPPGHSRLGDGAKSLVMGSALVARNTLRKVMGKKP